MPFPSRSIETKSNEAIEEKVTNLSVNVIKRVHYLTPRKRLLSCGDGQNTDPQSMDYPNGLSKWTTPKNNFPNEYYLMFLAASRLKLHIYKFRLCSSCTCGPYCIGKSTVTMRMLTPGNHQSYNQQHNLICRNYSI